jgi:hypothetical protein
MMSFSRTLLVTVALGLSATWSPPASADAAGDAVLARTDTAMNKARSLFFEYRIANQEPGKPERTLELRVSVKGEKRLHEFTGPADMKGTKILILSPTQMYVYLPAFGKVRRIASHTSDQSAFGMTFSQDDLATTSYGGSYQATIASRTATQTKLVLTPKAGKETPHAKIEMLVNNDKSLPAELKYFNAAGVNVKTETRSGYTCEGDVCTPGELKMVDNAKGNWTRLTRVSVKVNPVLSDEVFSQRSLPGG